jgi:C-terminal processing protease CtpA/Prc
MLSAQEQIYGVSLIWSEAKYNFAFWNVRNVDWDKAYRETVDKVMQPMPLVDYYLELMRFISLLNDGHTHIDFPQNMDNDFMALPIKIRRYSGKHIVTNTAVDCSIPAFSEILQINGMDFDTYMNERILPFWWNIKPSSIYEKVYTLQWVDNRLNNNADNSIYLFIPIIEKNKDITFSTSNGTYTVPCVPRKINWSLPYTLKCGEELTEIFTSKGLIINLTKDNLAIITLPTFMDNQMPSNFYEQLNNIKNCKGFIIDVRDNGGGDSNNAGAFSQAFIKGEFESGKVLHPLHNAAYYAWGNGGKGESFYKLDLSDQWAKKVHDVCTKNLFEKEITKAHYPECPLILTQPVVILENAATGSSSENLLINFDNINRATIVGVASYGTTGNPLFVDLPGGGRARICTRRYTYPNGKEFINIGIEPHIHADLTLDDLLIGKDSVLDKGLKVLRDKLCVPN